MNTWWFFAITVGAGIVNVTLSVLAIRRNRRSIAVNKESIALHKENQQLRAKLARLERDESGLQ